MKGMVSRDEGWQRKHAGKSVFCSPHSSPGGPARVGSSQLFSSPQVCRPFPGPGKSPSSISATSSAAPPWGCSTVQSSCTSLPPVDRDAVPMLSGGKIASRMCAALPLRSEVSKLYVMPATAGRRSRKSEPSARISMSSSEARQAVDLLINLMDRPQGKTWSSKRRTTAKAEGKGSALLTEIGAVVIPPTMNRERHWLRVINHRLIREMFCRPDFMNVQVIISSPLKAAKPDRTTNI